MSIDEKLYEIVQSNSNIVDKIWFNNNLEFAKQIYKAYDVDYNFDGILDIVRALKIVDNNEIKGIRYDVNKNTLEFGNKSDNIEYDLCKSFLQITSQKGLIRTDENGNEQWNNLNDIVIEKLILNTTGLERKEEIDEDKKTKQDELMYMITKLVSAKELISHFAYGKGQELYANYFAENNILSSK